MKSKFMIYIIIDIDFLFLIIMISNYLLMISLVE